ncbi:MAG: hypothetical protein U5K36_00795 [Roseovarius sp.]|nr:hypothetical protein [Roseovarius sp.]
MAAPVLPFALARDMQVLIEGGRLMAGPEAGAMGLREARRRAGIPLALDRLDGPDFEARLAALYRDDGEMGADDEGLTFDLEDGRHRAGAARPSGSR